MDDHLWLAIYLSEVNQTVRNWRAFWEEQNRISFKKMIKSILCVMIFGLVAVSALPVNQDEVDVFDEASFGIPLEIPEEFRMNDGEETVVDIQSTDEKHNHVSFQVVSIRCDSIKRLSSNTFNVVSFYFRKMWLMRPSFVRMDRSPIQMESAEKFGRSWSFWSIQDTQWDSSLEQTTTFKTSKSQRAKSWWMINGIGTRTALRHPMSVINFKIQSRNQSKVNTPD